MQPDTLATADGQFAAILEIVDAPAHEGDDAAMQWARAEILDAAHAAGHATDPGAYSASYHRVFAALDQLDARLATKRFYAGAATPTRVDWWLMCLLLRFDTVDYGLHKCNRNRLQEFDHLPGYVRDVFQWADIGRTYDPVVIKRYHYEGAPEINPKRLFPKGNGLDPWLPHDRAQRFGSEDLVAVGTEEQTGARARDGEFVRPQSRHRHFITADGSSGYPAAAGRYHLYVALNCPWCHRVVLGRELKGLTDVVSMDVLFYRRDPERGWQFKPDEPGCTPDTVFGYQFLRQIYERVGSTEKSAPVLYDRQTDTIVSNESAEILRMFDGAFGAIAPSELTLVPPALADEIDQLNAWIYRDINNGAYKAGFSNSQAAYEVAYDRLFAALDALDERLADRRFLTGDTLTEADVRLLPTIFRFDPIYYTRFRLNHKMIADYRHLSRWLQTMLDTPGVARASNLRHAKNGYFGRTGNNIVPLGPAPREP